MYGYIYKITNTINTKVYIGQTTKTIEKRFAQHCQKAKNITQREYGCIHLYAAMNKYGVDKFTVVEIDHAWTKEELNRKEDIWINFYNAINGGYNMMPGGNDKNPMDSIPIKERHDTIMRLDETRKKISRAMQEYRAKNSFSEEHKQKIKAAREQRKVERAAKGLGFYEHPEHMAQRSMGCYCLLASGERYEFNSILEAGKW